MGKNLRGGDITLVHRKAKVIQARPKPGERISVSLPQPNAKTKQNSNNNTLSPTPPKANASFPSTELSYYPAQLRRQSSAACAHQEVDGVLAGLVSCSEQLALRTGVSP